MPFPTSNISATSIRNELASNNTGGVQTPVTLNDTAVRAAANRPSGTVSYGDLSGVNVLFSGLITLGTRFIQPIQFNFLRYWGYFPNFAPQFGGAIGSLNTASYYRISGAALSSFGYNASTGTSAIRTIIQFDSFTSFDVNTISVNFDTTRVTAVPTALTIGGWLFIGDPFDFQNRAPSSPTQVVITYT
jgi:hypothetical protein